MTRFSILTTCFALAVAAPVMAATTEVAPGLGGEPGHADILGSSYGGAFTATDAGFTNGTITANRVDDALDQTFAGGDYTATGLDRNAGFSQSFGYIADDGFQTLFDAEADGSGTGSVQDLPDGVAFARGGSGDLFSTVAADNSDGSDHVVTYEIFGLDTEDTVYALFIEDTINGDQDFNDLVVQIRQGGLASTPAPTALGSGLLMLAIAGVRRRRRA